MLLSSIMGIDLRTTMDMDTTIVGIDMNQEELKRILMEILSIDVDDNVRFEYISTSKIKDEDLYGGFRFKINAYLNKLRANLQIDVATGDIITPRAIETFDHQKTDIHSIKERFEQIRENSKIDEQWRNYSKKHHYTINISKNDLMNEIEKIVELFSEDCI